MALSRSRQAPSQAPLASAVAPYLPALCLATVRHSSGKLAAPEASGTAALRGTAGCTKLCLCFGGLADKSLGDGSGTGSVSRLGPALRARGAGTAAAARAPRRKWRAIFCRPTSLATQHAQHRHGFSSAVPRAYTTSPRQVSQPHLTDRHSTRRHRQHRQQWETTVHRAHRALRTSTRAHRALRRAVPVRGSSQTPRAGDASLKTTTHLAAC